MARRSWNAPDEEEPHRGGRDDREGRQKSLTAKIAEDAKERIITSRKIAKTTLRVAPETLPGARDSKGTTARLRSFARTTAMRLGVGVERGVRQRFPNQVQRIFHSPEMLGQ